MSNIDLIATISRIAFSSITVTFFYALWGNVLFQVPFRLKRIFTAIGVLFIGTLLKSFNIGGSLSMVFIVLPMVAVGCILWIPMERFRFFLCLITGIVSEYLIEYITITLYILLGGYYYEVEILGQNVFFLDPPTIPLYAIALCVSLFLPIVVIYLIRNRKRSWTLIGSYRSRIAFLCLLLLILMITLAVWTTQVQGTLENKITFRQGLSNMWNLVFFIPIFVILLFLWESIQQVRLFQNNKSLLEKNEAYQSILNSQREFAHNIANMIYGFEGVILTGDIATIRKYYAELSRRCILNNNENANAINRINEPALASLLLRKLDRAASLDLPIYLTVDPGFSFRRFTESHMTSIVGNLVDNAIEAAQKAESPRIDITLCKGEKYETILIANTFSRDADLSFLSGHVKSSKSDHEATGIASVQSILRRYPDVFCNQYLRGRYVETNLSCYR